MQRALDEEKLSSSNASPASQGTVASLPICVPRASSACTSRGHGAEGELQATASSCSDKGFVSATQGHALSRLRKHLHSETRACKDGGLSEGGWMWDQPGSPLL